MPLLFYFILFIYLYFFLTLLWKDEKYKQTLSRRRESLTSFESKMSAEKLGS